MTMTNVVSSLSSVSSCRKRAVSGCGVFSRRMSLSTLLLPFIMLVLARVSSTSGSTHHFIRCSKCDVSRCPVMHYCEGQAIKDHCGCCTMCSSSKFQPHVVIVPPKEGDACAQVKCPKLKVCVENMQGLPLCTCPSEFVCRRSKQREVCGTDGKTHLSRCHMRITSCNEGVVVRKKHRGVCTEEDRVKDSARFQRRVNRMKKRKRRRKEDDNGEERGKRRKKKERRRKRRKSGSRKKRGKSRIRRHRKAHSAAGKSFEEAFAHYTWKA